MAARPELSHIRACADKRKVVSFVCSRLQYTVEAQFFTQVSKTGAFILVGWVREGKEEPGWKVFRFADIRDFWETPECAVPRTAPQLTAYGNLAGFASSQEGS